MTNQVDFEPIGRRHACPKGTTLLEAARQAGVGIVSICGGRGTCGHCRVQILDGQASVSERLGSAWVSAHHCQREAMAR